jgi:hypothetical protein
MLIGVGIGVTLVFLCYLFGNIKPNLHEIEFVLFFGACLLFPYIILAYSNESRFHLLGRPRTYIILVVIMLLTGILSIIDVTFIHPDPLGPIALLFATVPIQLVLLGIIFGYCKR